MTSAAEMRADLSRLNDEQRRKFALRRGWQWYSLDAAWAEAVAELPEGVGLELATLALDDWAEAVAGGVVAQGPTPAAALRALAARLRDPRP